MGGCQDCSRQLHNRQQSIYKYIHRSYRTLALPSDVRHSNGAPSLIASSPQKKFNTSLPTGQLALLKPLLVFKPCKVASSTNSVLPVSNPGGMARRVTGLAVAAGGSGGGRPAARRSLIAATKARWSMSSTKHFDTCRTTAIRSGQLGIQHHMYRKLGDDLEGTGSRPPQ